MKATLFLTLALISTRLFAQSPSEAADYMANFSTSYSQIQQDMWDYTRSVSHGKNARKVEKRRFELIASSDLALKNAQKAKPYYNDASYRDSVVKFFTVMNLVLREDYAKLVDMEEVAEQSYDLMEAYMLAKELASQKQKDAAEMVNAEQKKFAEKNNVNLIESSSELSGKMEIAGMVYKHYNAVYLIFFKSNKQELYLMDAIGKSDVSAIEQNRNSLISTVDEGREKLKTVELYENDKSMIDVTNQLFDFYAEEAKSMDLVLDYFMKGENFQKVKSAFESKKEKDRTKEDVDGYNKAVNELNSAVNAYNAQNDRLNKKRAELIDNWNKTGLKFTSTHVPKGK